MSGYNMVHFTPIQTLGSSQSAYSLCDQQGLNSSFSTPSSPATMEAVAEVVEGLRRDWGLLSICDIVLNHTANNTGWLEEHSDATYNLANSPHLRPAFLLDRCVKRLAREVGEGRWVEEGVPRGEVSTAAHLEACRGLLESHYLPRVAIPELFLCDVEPLVAALGARVAGVAPSSAPAPGEVVLVQDPAYRRLASTVDLALAAAVFNVAREDINQEEERVAACLEAFRTHLLRLNSLAHARVMVHLKAAMDNIVSGAAFQHVEPAGPRATRVSVSEAEELVAPYFTCPDLATLEEEVALAWGEEGRRCMAHNGWVMGDDPLRNFALADSAVYLRRELVAWGDSVKLRYGERPADSPFLWSYMEQYVVATAGVFDGVRLDNCHSTPLHVAAHMLDAARRVRPDLYVSAELFTGSEEKDNVFVNRLGITSLIRWVVTAGWSLVIIRVLVVVAASLPGRAWPPGTATSWGGWCTGSAAGRWAPWWRRPPPWRPPPPPPSSSTGPTTTRAPWRRGRCGTCCPRPPWWPWPAAASAPTAATTSWCRTTFTWWRRRARTPAGRGSPAAAAWWRPGGGSQACTSSSPGTATPSSSWTSSTGGVWYCMLCLIC